MNYNSLQGFYPTKCPLAQKISLTSEGLGGVRKKVGQTFLVNLSVRKARLELAQEKLPLPPQSSASTISPLPRLGLQR